MLKMQHHATLLIAIAACSVAACSSGESGSSGTTPVAAITSPQSDAAAQVPPIHVEQTVVLLRDGQPAIEQNYRQALSKCSGDPGVPVTPLGGDVVDKLGRSYMHIWYQGTRMVVQDDEWNFDLVHAPGAGLSCHFEPVHVHRVHVYTREVAAASADASGGSDDDPAQKAQVEALLKQHGYGNAVPQDGGADTAAGQPCRRRSNGVDGESCMWTGGAQWGFSPDADVHAGTAATDGVLLWRKPANGQGEAWSTQSMTVGTPIEQSVFAQQENPGTTTKH